MKVFLIICASVIWMASIGKGKYCHIACQKGNHIGCRNNGQLGAECTSSSELVNLSPKEKGHFLFLHNKLRDDIAGGNIEGYHSAARMATMSWDEELAELAALNVKKCDMKHDKCRNTNLFRNVGQNVGTWVGFPAITPIAAIDYVFGMWEDERSETPMSVINNFQKSGLRSGKFAIMVNEKNFKIGCAMLSTIQWGMPAFIVTCNYAHDNVIGEKVYKQGPPISGCETGKDPSHHNLCSSSEKYEV